MTQRNALLTGAFHPALEDALLTDLAEHARREPGAPALVVVPTNLLGLRLSRRLAERIGSHAGLRFMTLKDLAERHAPVPLPGGRALLPHGGDEAALRRVLDGGAAAGGHFEPIADRPGFARALLSSIGDLKEACYTPADLEAAAARAGLARRGRPGKLAEVVRLWREHEAFLEGNGWADERDVMRAAADALASKGAGGPAETPPFFLYGFYDLNALQKRLAAACCARGRARVYFPWLDTPAFRYARPTLEWFESLGLPRERVGEREGRDVPLPATLPISAPGEAREAREDVRTLLRVLEERGLSFQDAGVLLRSQGDYSDLFAEEITQAGARPYVETPCPLARTPAGRAALALVDAVASDFGRIEVMEFLGVADPAREGAPAAARRGGDDAPPVSDWNKASVLAGIVRGAGEWVGALESLAASIEAAPADGSFRSEHGHLARPIASLVALLRELVPPLAGLAPGRGRTQAAEISAYADAVEAALARFAPREGLDEALDAVSSLRALAPVAGPVTLSRFAELLREALDAPQKRGEKFESGGPAVLSLMSARGLPFRVVVVPGLVEKMFPLHRRQDPILLDDERRALNAARGNDPLASFPDRAAGAEEEDLLFHLAVSAATDALVLSWPRLEPATARPRVPSRFALAAVSLLEGRPLDYDALDRSPVVERVPLGRRFPKDRREALTRDEFDGCSILGALASGDPAEVAYLVHEEGPLRRGLAMEAARFGTPGFTVYDGATDSKEALAAVRALAGISRDGSALDAPVSATSLEDYARCPFAYFVRHLLGVRPLEEPEDAAAPTPLERGELYHAVLDEFLKRSRKAGRIQLSRGDLDALLRAARETAGSGRWAFASRAGSRELELLDLGRNLALWLWGEVTEGSPFRPAYFEARFGGRARADDDPELSLEGPVPFEAAGGVRVAFRGKIDRIDLDAARGAARVIDYKTGKPTAKASAVFDRGRTLQLPVYILAAQAMLDAAALGAKVESAEYLYVTAQRRESRSLSREDLEGARDEFAKAVGLIVKGIAEGMFFPWPQENRCDSCDFAAACGTNSVVLALARMKQGDRRAKFFTEGLAVIE